MIDTGNENWLFSLLPQAVQLTRQAGAAVMQVYNELNPAVEYKRDQSPLTQADLASHDILVDGLTQLTPGWPVLSEESAEVPFEQRRAWPRFWLVDPLDGTKEFLKGNGEFTVNVALIDGDRPILGVVGAPAMDKLYYAARGAGAWKEDAGSVAPIRVAHAPAGTIRLVVSRSHSHGKEDVSPWTGSDPHTFVPMGSSLKFCLVADGSADLYPRLGPTMEWDTAAAHCIVEVAGGTVTDLHGNPMLYNKPSLLNPGFVARGQS
jgi:3'(2'), 5'-bisphosphate nucleotidase